MPARALLGVLLFAALAQTAGAAEGVDVRYAEPLRGYSLTARSGAALGKPTTAEHIDLSFIALGRAFDLALEPNGRLAGAARKLELAPGVMAYTGTVSGRPDSWARIVLTPEGPSGLIYDAQTLYAVETAGDTAVQAQVAAGGPVVYRLADVYLAPGTLGCAVADATADASQALDAMTGEFAVLAAQGARLNLDIGAVADFEFSQNFADPSAAMLTRLNNVDGIFSEQVGVQVTVAQVDVFSSADEPFTTTNPQDLLNEVAEYRAQTSEQDAQGLTHLFTGRNLDGSTAGIAFVGTLCSHKSRFDPLGRSFGAGLTEGRHGAAIDSLIAAHEIGHNFGAPHDAEAGSPCETTPATFLMAPSINGSDQFSQCSLDQMQTEIASASCLTAIGAADVELASAVPNRQVPAGIDFDYVLNVTNLGVDAATGVVVDVAPDRRFEVQAAVAGSGTCTLGAHGVTCSLGDIPGQSVRQVTVTMRSSAVGNLPIDAAATADTDADTGNNTVADAVNVTPVIDLALAGSAESLLTGQQETVTATLDDAADFAASGVTLNAALTSGLQADGAALGGVACSITGQNVTCPSRSLNAREKVEFTLTVTGLTAGSERISVSATGNETDLVPGNNDLTLPVTVTAPPEASGSSSGGGSMSWASLLLLGLAALARRRATLGPQTRGND